MMGITYLDYELVNAHGLTAYYPMRGVLVKVAACDDAMRVSDFLQEILEHAKNRLNGSKATYVYYYIFGYNTMLRRLLKWLILNMKDPKVQYRKCRHRAKIYVYR